MDSITGGLRLSDLQGALGNASGEAVTGQVDCSVRAGVRNGDAQERETWSQAG